MDFFAEIDEQVSETELARLRERSRVECGSWKDRRWRQYHRWGKRGPGDVSQEIRRIRADLVEK